MQPKPISPPLTYVTLCSFQTRDVYNEILEHGRYQLSRKIYDKNMENAIIYEPYRRIEKYQRLMAHSGLDFSADTLPMWAWYTDAFPDGIQLVSKERYEGVLQRERQNNGDTTPEIVGLLLRVPKTEIHLSNLYHWDAYLFSEVYDAPNFDEWPQEQQGWYLADLAQAEYHFKKMQEINDSSPTQAILPEIRRDMIFDVLFETSSTTSPKSTNE